ncbi:extracellular solute-binding protein, partial [Streptomyces nigra]
MTAVLGGCGVTGDTDDVTLRLVAADYGDSKATSSRKYWDKLTEAYEAEHPGVTVDVEVYSWNEVDAKVKEMVAAGEAPDLAQIGAYADYAAKDLLYPADDLSPLGPSRPRRRAPRLGQFPARRRGHVLLRH